MDERVSGWCCVCNWAHQCFTVGFLRFPYSVVCTVESLSLCLSLFNLDLYVLGDDLSIC